MPRIGVVAIGRNEGPRLRRCLESVRPLTEAVVYVDSASTDDSLAIAREVGVEIVELDLSIPFSAARGRNEGFRRLRERWPDVQYVQFTDGDCEVHPDWLPTAMATLDARPEVAVVCGRRRERHPETSVYNRLCDIEWNTPIGETRACGGDALMRVDALERAGGYDPSVIAAEDDEVCLRIRRGGSKVLRIDADMTLHDAAMTRVGQWWKRAVRCGYAYAQGASLHGAGPERHFVHQCRRIWIWGLIVPAVSLLLAWPTWGLSLLMLLAYPLQAFRVYRTTRPKVARASDAVAWAVSCTMSKFPELFGMLRFYRTRWAKARPKLIEYK